MHHPPPLGSIIYQADQCRKKETEAAFWKKAAFLSGQTAEKWGAESVQASFITLDGV